MSGIRASRRSLFVWGGYVVGGLLLILLFASMVGLSVRAQAASDRYEWINETTILAKPSGIRYVFKPYQPARSASPADPGGPAVPAHYAPDLPAGQQVERDKGLATKLIDMSGDRKSAKAVILGKCTTSGITQQQQCETVNVAISIDTTEIMTCPDGTIRQGVTCVNVVEQDKRVYEQVVLKYLAKIAGVPYGGWAAKNCGRVGDCSKDGFMKTDFSAAVKQCLLSTAKAVGDDPAEGTPRAKDGDKLFASCLAGKYPDLKGLENDIRAAMKGADLSNLAQQVIKDTINPAAAPALLCNSPQVPSEDGTSCVDPPEDKPACAVPGVGWIVCPVVNFLAGIADETYNFLADSLLQIESSLVGKGTKDAWEVMRGFANAAFVIFFLIIIYSQITGMGITNYGIKKLLPKLVIVAILVNVSFVVCQLAVDLSNILGYGIKGLFESIGVQIPLPKDIPTGTVQTGSGGLGFVGGATAVLAMGAGIYVALPFLGGAILAAVVAGLTIGFLLIARKALIILLIVIAPLAFVAFLLPNTEGLFKKWYKVFSSMLLVFPIVGLLFGAGQLASQILRTSAGNDVILNIVASVAAVLPLFLVWSVMKKSMEAAGAVSGMIQNIGKGANKMAQDRYGESKLGQAGKYALERRKQQRTLTQAGAYKGNNIFRKASSSLNKRFNQSRISGQFGNRSAAMGVAMVAEEEQKAVDRAAVLMKSQTNPAEELDYATKQLQEANKTGDKTKARAATKILLNSGGLGKKRLRDALNSMESSPGGIHNEIKNDLRSDINSAGLKGSDNALATWGYTNRNIADIQADQKTYSGLNAVELAGQAPDLLGSTHVTADQANSVLSNDAAAGILTEEKRAILEAKRGGQAAPQPQPGSTMPSGFVVPTADDINKFGRGGRP